MIKINDFSIPQYIEELSWGTYKRIMSLDNFETLDVLSAVIDLPKSKLTDMSYVDFPFFVAIETINSFLTKENLNSLTGFDISHLVSGFDIWQIKGGQIAQAFDLGNAKLSDLETVENLVSIFHFGSMAEKEKLQNYEAWKVLSMHAFFLGSWQKLHKLSTQSIQSAQVPQKKNKRTQNLFSGLHFGKPLINWLREMF